MIEEVWRDIINYIGLYMVSNYGKIKSLSRYGCKKNRILKPEIKRDGYVYISLYKNGIGKQCAVHKLVLESFIGPCPKGMESCHNDGNPSNNRLDNLRHDSRKNNNKDKIKHGTFTRGTQLSWAKLNDNKIIEIRKLHSEGRSDVEIGKIYNVSRQTIWYIVNYKIWKHVK